MPEHFTRRILLQRAALSAAALLGGAGMPSLHAQESQRGTTRTIPLGDGLWLLSSDSGNSLLLATAGEAALVDGSTAAEGRALQAAILQAAGTVNVRYLVNSNWRPRHTGSNELFAATGATIVAHENTRLWMGTDIEVQWEQLSYPPSKPAALPTKTFYTDTELQLGGRVLRCGHAPRAHTDGDLHVHLPGNDLLFAGDLLAVGAYPIADYVTGGWIDGLIAANESLLKLCGDATRIIPGKGSVQGRAQLLAQLEMCRSVRERTVALMKQGLGLREIMAAAPTREFDAHWGDSALFLYLIYHGVIDHVRETGGIG
ncbi:MAG: MBL fold metallo-hydrolase [Steroidobacteraceae bacterium]